MSMNNRRGRFAHVFICILLLAAAIIAYKIGYNKGYDDGHIVWWHYSSPCYGTIKLEDGAKK